MPISASCSELKALKLTWPCRTASVKSRGGGGHLYGAPSRGAILGVGPPPVPEDTTVANAAVHG